MEKQNELLPSTMSLCTARHLVTAETSLHTHTKHEHTGVKIKVCVVLQYVCAVNKQLMFPL